jgi:endonuclease/exonuclease/phosphatase family metal-dependent hydrolase
VRSRLRRVTERGGGYAQVNRPLFDEFATVLGRIEWDFALLQEAPPRWFDRLCAATGSSGAIALTSRNFGRAVRAALANWNPDLIASNEGGSNQLLVREPWTVASARRHTVARVPERRRVLLARVEAAGGDPDGGALAVANLHGSVGSVRGAPDQVIEAASAAVEFAGDLPLVFAGDLNLRPATHPEVFETLEKRFGLAPPTDPDAIDHILARGLQVVEPPHPLQASVREVTDVDGSLIRLSDHACVVVALGMK